MIVPKFNKGRLGNPNAVGNAINTLIKPITQTIDARIESNLKAKEKAAKEKEKVEVKTAKAKEKAAGSQDKAAKTYIQETIKAKKGTTLTTAEKRKNVAIRKQNKAAASYMSYSPDKVSVKVKGSAGRPNSNASQKIATPKAPKTARTNVNKTAARRSRPAPKVTAVPKVKQPAAPGRRKKS